MKKTHFDQKLQLCAVAILGCGLIACGCNPSNLKAPVESKPKIESVTPPVEDVPDGADSTESTPETSAAPLAEGPGESNPVESSPDPHAMPVEPSQSWSVQRIIVFSATGPIIVDVSANIEGKSLDAAAEAATGRAIAQIAKDLEKPWTWAKLLDHPLIRSGWLGNLVDDGDKRDQLLRMYNKDGDDEADEDELPAFLTRGLANSPAFQFSDIGNAPGTIESRSPWDQLDTNQDSALDKSEIENIPKVVASFDLNSDLIVTVAEVQATRAAMSTQTARVQNQKLISAVEMRADQKLEQVSKKILEHYNTFSMPLSRSQWSGWTDKRWNALDKDGDGEISSKDLEPLRTVQPELELQIQFQANSESGISISAKVGAESDFTWASRLKTAGQATGKSGAFAVVVTDSYTATSRSNLRALLSDALSNPQVAMSLRTQLQLSENAFDYLDADNDDKLSDEEFENAWEWLTAIRGNRILSRWMIADSAWFRMADTDADGRLTEIETQKFLKFLVGLDQDNDGTISPIEIPQTADHKPIAIRLEIARMDSRLPINRTSGTGGETLEVGWFAASDSNNDDFINKTEFLGSEEDFLGYDTDNDGFISKTEAYKGPNSRVQ